jgi:hypothetical protein
MARMMLAFSCVSDGWQCPGLAGCDGSESAGSDARRSESLPLTFRIARLFELPIEAVFGGVIIAW